MQGSIKGLLEGYSDFSFISHMIVYRYKEPCSRKLEYFLHLDGACGAWKMVQLSYVVWFMKLETVTLQRQYMALGLDGSKRPAIARLVC